MSNDNRNWTPVLKGAIYCSPACGGKCTKDKFDEATDRAKWLADKLGPGWKPRVHENLGWHWGVVKGDGLPGRHRSLLEVSERNGKYNVMLNTNPQFVRSGPDVNECIEDCLTALHKHIAELNQAFGICTDTAVE